MSPLPTLDPQIRAELLKLGTATLYEAGGRDLDIDPALQAAWPGATVCGPALTVRTGAADNLALHRAVAEPHPGCVLVVDGQQAACGYWGEILTVAAQQAGITGLVLDGGVRDIDQLHKLDFGTFSRHRSIRRTIKRDAGEIGGLISVGGRLVRAGDIVVGDADGLLVIPAEHLDETLAASRRRAADEVRYCGRIAAGEVTLDIYGFRELLEAGPTQNGKR